MKRREILAFIGLGSLQGIAMADDTLLPQMSINHTVHKDIRELSKNAKPSIMLESNTTAQCDTLHKAFRRQLRRGT